MSIKTSFYSDSELSKLGLKKYGKNVKISKKISIYEPEKISISDNVRIDDFCILSGNITIGSYVHIAAYCGLFGKGGIIIENFSGVSSRVIIYSASDNYLGEALTNPTVPDEFRKIDCGPVTLAKHVVVGSGSVILPNTKIEIGAAIGALSLVKGTIDPWGIYTGIPAKLKAQRKSSIIIEYEKKLLGN